MPACSIAHAAGTRPAIVALTFPPAPPQPERRSAAAAARAGAAAARRRRLPTDPGLLEAGRGRRIRGRGPPAQLRVPLELLDRGHEGADLRVLLVLGVDRRNGLEHGPLLGRGGDVVLDA